MKVAWLIENLLYWNGGNKYIYILGRRIRQNCDVDIFVTKASAENKKLFNDVGLRVIEFSDVATDSLRYWLFYPYCVWRNAQKLQHMLAGYDVVISVNTDWLVSKLNKKIIYMCLEPNPWLYSPAFIKGRPIFQRILANFGIPLARWYDQTIKRNKRWMVAVDKFNADRLNEIYGLQSTIVRVGVDTELFNRKQNWILGKLYSNYEVIIHSSSNLSQAKGTRLLMEAMPKIIAEIPNCRLLILNANRNDKEQSELLRIAQKLGVELNIEFLPPIKEEMLPYYYSLAKVVIQPSIYPAGAHLPLAEGGACEIPGITFDGTANVEDVINGETGYVVSYGNTEELAQKTIAIIKNRQRSEVMGKKARELAQNLFSWDRNADVLWDLIQEVYSK